MNLDNIEEAEALIFDLREYEDLMDRLDRRVFSIILTDGSQKNDDEALKKRAECIIHTIFPGGSDDGTTIQRLGQIFIEKLRAEIDGKIEAIKAKLATL